MDDLTPQEAPKQEPSIWDKVDALTPRNNSIWDKVDAIQEDPKKKQINFVLQEGAARNPEKAARVIRVANRFKLPEQFVEQNLDRLEQEEKKGSLASEDLANTNAFLAEAITKSPNYSAAALKHLPILKQLETLYTKPPQLWPLSDQAKVDQARGAAKIMAERKWASQGGKSLDPNIFPRSEFGENASAYASSQQEMEDMFFKRELDQINSDEQFIQGGGQVGLLEGFTEPFRRSGPAAGVPVLAHIPELMNQASLAMSKQNVKDGQPDDLDRYILNRAARLEAAANMRGKSYMGHIGEAAAHFPAMAGEMMMGGTIGRGARALFGLSGKTLKSKAAGALLEAGVGSLAAGAGQTAESAVRNVGAGDSAASAIGKGAANTFIDYLSGQAFGPWFSKASPEVQTLAKQSLLLSMPTEALKMVGMTAAADLMKSGAQLQPFHGSLIQRLVSGDPEAIKEVVAQGTIGAVSGGMHTVFKNRSIDQAKAQAQQYADAAIKRGELLVDVVKESPEIAKDFSERLSVMGPGKYTLVPAEAFREHYGDMASDIVTKLTGDRERFDHSIKSGVDISVPTAAFDGIIGADPTALKFFSSEIRPESGMMNLREAKGLENAYASGMRFPARDRIVQQIVESAKGDKVVEAVGRAKLDQGSENLLRDPAILGLSDEQITRVSGALAKGQEHAEGVIRAKETERRDALKSDLYANEQKRQTEATTAEVSAKQEYRVLEDIQNGRIKGEVRPEMGSPPKISREILKEFYPGVKLSDLPPGVTNTPGSEGVGIHPDELAQLHGYASGQDLLWALMGANKKKAIEDLVTKRMGEKFPGGLSPTELSAEAEKALYSKHGAELKRLALEYIADNKLSVLKGMVKIASRKPPRMEDVTAGAERDIRGLRLDQLDPKAYLEAERRAESEAQATVWSGEWEKVFDAKLKSLEASERYRVATDAVERANKTLDGWRKLVDATHLNKPGTFEWGQQVKNLLRRIGLVAVDPRDLATRQPFDKWAQAKFDSGETRMESLRLPEKFSDESQFLNSPDELTYGDLSDLKDTIDQLNYYAKDIGKIQVAAKKVAIESWVERAVESVGKFFKKRPPEPLTDSGSNPLDKALAFGRKFDASLDRPEAFFDRLDGGDISGPFNEALWQRQVEGRVKYAALKRQFSEAVRKAVDEMPKDIQRRLDDKVKLPGVDIPITRREIMAIVANGGNESSYSKMVRGEAMREGVGLTHEKIQEAAKLLTESELDYVQKILDITNEFWPEIEKLHVWATGKAPFKIEAKQMIEAMGNRKGGYYPAMYDRRFSKTGDIQISGELGKLVDPSYRSATTDGGARESRIEEFAAPMDFNFNRLASHVDAIAKDIAFRPWLMDANKMMNSPELLKALKDHLGSEYQDFIRAWVKRVVGVENSSSQSASIWAKGIGTLRHNVTLARLALKPSVFLKNALGIGPAIVETGGLKWFGKGYAEFLAHPKDSYQRMVAESPEMAHFLDTFDANIRASLDRLGTKTGTYADVQRFGMKVIPAGNIMLSVPTYFGAKARATAELSAKGHTGAELESLAIRAGEKAVRKALGSGNPGDLPAVMGSEGMKLLLMFYTPGSVQYAQMKDAVHDFKRTGDLHKFLFQAFWLLPASAAINSMLSGHVPDEDRDESYAGMIAKDVITQPFSALPMGSDISKKALDAATGSSRKFEVTSPAFAAISEAFESIDKTADWYKDEAEFEDVARQLFKTAGLWAGAPTDQLEISGGYLFDLARSRGENPNDLWEFMHDFLWRRPKSRR